MAGYYLQGMAKEYEHKATEAPTSPNKGKDSPTEWNAFARWTWEVARRQAAARAFRDVARELEKSEKDMT